MNHPRSNIERLYVKRKAEDKGLLQTEATYTAEKINIVEYLNTNYADYYFVNTFKDHENNQPNRS